VQSAASTRWQPSSLTYASPPSTGRSTANAEWRALHGLAGPPASSLATRSVSWAPRTSPPPGEHADRQLSVAGTAVEGTRGAGRAAGGRPVRDPRVGRFRSRGRRCPSTGRRSRRRAPAGTAPAVKRQCRTGAPAAARGGIWAGDWGADFAGCRSAGARDSAIRDSSIVFGLPPQSVVRVGPHPGLRLGGGDNPTRPKRARHRAAPPRSER
jgi:hypothetical protein